MDKEILAAIAAVPGCELVETPEAPFGFAVRVHPEERQPITRRLDFHVLPPGFVSEAVDSCTLHIVHGAL